MAMLGLDLGASAVKAVLVEDGARPRLLASAVVDHARANWLSELSAESTAAAAAAALRPLVKQAISGLGWTRQYRVRVTVADPMAITQIQRPRDVPDDPQTARMAMGEAVRKELNLGAGWRVADCVVLERPPRGGARPCRVIVSVAPTALVEALHTLVADVGFRMTHLDTNTWAIGSLASERLAATSPEDLYGVLNLGHSFTSLALYKGESLEDFAVADVGTTDAVEMLASVVGQGPPREVLRRRPLVPVGEHRDDPQVFEAFGAIAPMIERLGTLVRDRLESYALYWGNRPLSRLVLAGGLSAIPGLAPLLEQEFHCSAGVLPVADWLSGLPDASRADLPALAPAIGMCLRGA